MPKWDVVSVGLQKGGLDSGWVSLEWSSGCVWVDYYSCGVQVCVSGRVEGLVRVCGLAKVTL